jgi:WD40 repeat protein
VTYPPTDPTQHRVIERRRPFKNRPISRQHVNYDETALYHYQEDNDRRFINWRRLYRNRNLIERRWRDGQYWMHMFPLGVTSSPRATASTTANDDGDDDDDTRHSDWIYCLQFNSQILVSGSRDRTLKIWAMDSGTCLHTLYGHEASVLCLQFDDRWIISGSSDTQMVVWDVTTGKKVRQLMGHSESVLNLRFVGNRLVSSSKDRTIRVWDLDKGVTTQVLRGHRAAVNAVQFKDDLVVSASGDRTIRLWNAVSAKKKKKISPPDSLLTLAFFFLLYSSLQASPSGRLILIAVGLLVWTLMVILSSLAQAIKKSRCGTRPQGIVCIPWRGILNW